MAQTMSSNGLYEFPFDPKDYNVVLPTQAVTRIAQWHRVAWSFLKASPDPDAGDVFKVGSKSKKVGDDWVNIAQYSMLKPFLNALSSAAGIIWLPQAHRVLYRDSHRVEFGTTGLMRLPDGSWQPVPGTKEIDLDTVELELRHNAMKRATEDGLTYDEAKKWPNKGEWRDLPGDEGGKAKKKFVLTDPAAAKIYVEQQVMPALIQWRKSVVPRAETGAMNRAIRSCLALKATYTLEELAKPFAVPRVEWAPDLNDPMVKQLVLQQGAIAMSGLFTQIGALSGPTAMPALPAGDRVREPLAVVEDDEPAEPIVAEVIMETTPATPPRFDPVAAAQDMLDKTEPVNLQEALPKAAATEPLGQPVPAAKTTGSEPTGDQCTVCGVTPTAGVVKFSRERFGKVICMKCRSKAGVEA